MKKVKISRNLGERLEVKVESQKSWGEKCLWLRRLFSLLLWFIASLFIWLFCLSFKVNSHNPTKNKRSE